MQSVPKELKAQLEASTVMGIDGNSDATTNMSL